MDWRNDLQRAIRINEEEIMLLESMIPQAPSQEVQQMLGMMITQEKEEMRIMREMLMGGHMYL